MFAKIHRSAAIAVFATAFALIATAQTAAQQCKRPELHWEAWRDHALANNPNSDYVELRGEGRDRIIRAYDCNQENDKCPPDQVMVFFCTEKTTVLLAFVKKGCVTLADDMRIEDFRQYIVGGVPC